MEFILKYSSEQRLISFSENVSDQRNAINTVSVTFAASQEGINTSSILRWGQTKPRRWTEQYVSFAIIVARKTSVSDVAGSPLTVRLTLCARHERPGMGKPKVGNPIRQCNVCKHSSFLAHRTNDRAYAIVLRLSVCRLWRYVLWLNGASWSKS